MSSRADWTAPRCFAIPSRLQPPSSPSTDHRLLLDPDQVLTGERKLCFLQLPGMETSFVLGSSEQLGIAFKKRLEHDSGITLKVRGVLNTVTAKCEVQGALNKVGLGSKAS